MTGRRIPLRDAAYTLKTGLKLFSRRASSAALQKDKQYKEFIRHNEAKGWNNERLAGEKGRVYAVATDEGVLFFSDSEKGMKARNSYLQHLADGFFNMAKGTETLKMYEMETPSRQVAELADNCIDKLAKSDLRSAGTQLRKSEFSFTSEKLAGKEMLEGAVCTDKYDLRPDYNNFDRLTRAFNLGISPRNYDVASLLYISENGYAGHVAADYFHPFSYEYEFRDLAEKLGDSIKARQSAPMSSHDFGYAALQMEAKAMARDILQSEFHSKYSINSLVYWVTYVHNVVYSFYRSMIYCYINSTQRCAGSIVIDIIPTNGADKRKFFPFAPYFPVTNVIKRYFYPYFPAIIGIKGYSFPYFPYLSGIMKIKTALYSLFSRLDWHKTVVFPCLGEIYEGIRSLSWEIPVT